MRKVLFIFGQLTDGDVEWLTQNGKKEAFASGAVLIQAGAQIDSLFIVLDGELAVTDARSRAVVARLGTGEIVGEMSFVDGSPPSANVATVGKVQALRIPRALLSAKLDGDPLFAARFYRAIATLLSDRLRERTTKRSSADLASLDTKVLSSIHLAGLRFERMVKQLGGT